MFRKVITILASFFLVANVLQADFTQKFHEMKLSKLRGITDIRISVSIPYEFEKEANLSDQRVKDLIELRFRQSGIMISNDARNTFFISVQFVKGYCCATYIDTELWGNAYLEKNNAPVCANIWEESSLISGGVGDDLGKSVLSKIEAFADKFLNLYLEANPREFIQKPIVN